MTSIKTPRTCHELGVCQARQPACQGSCAQASAQPAAQRDGNVNTAHLPPHGFYFAPGAIEQAPRRQVRRLAPWQRLVLQAMGVLLASGLIGFAAAALQAKGWPL